jgi:hypothetical protein
MPIDGKICIDGRKLLWRKCGDRWRGYWEDVYLSGAKKQLRDRDGDNCWLCGEAMLFYTGCPSKSERRKAATIDHVIAKVHGGGNSMFNLRLAHMYCNSRKSNKISVPAIVAMFPGRDKAILEIMAEAARWSAVKDYKLDLDKLALPWVDSMAL